METILLAEDEQILGRLVKEALERKSYKVLWVQDGQEALDVYKNNSPQLCIFDVMMPSLNGFVLASKIRAISPNVPILFLTARSETSDVVKGFEVGGNDYLKKPFSLDELFVRIRELLRRSLQQPNLFATELKDESFTIGIYEFHPISQTLTSDKEVINLSYKETMLLHALVVHKNHLMPRRDALIKIWGDDNFFHSRTMDVYITKLRKYLKRDDRLSIVNIRGLGYKLIDDHR